MIDGRSPSRYWAVRTKRHSIVGDSGHERWPPACVVKSSDRNVLDLRLRGESAADQILNPCFDLRSMALSLGAYRFRQVKPLLFGETLLAEVMIGIAILPVVTGTDWCCREVRRILPQSAWA